MIINKLRSSLKNNLPINIYGVILFLFFMGDGLYNIAFPIYLVSIGLSYDEVGKLIASYGIGIAVFQLVVGSHSDSVGKSGYIIASLFLDAGLNLLFYFSQNILWLTIILVTKGFARGAFFAVRAPLIKDISTPEKRGRAFGIIGAFSTAGFAFGGLILGHAYSIKNPRSFFIIISMFYILAGIIAALGMPRFCRQKGNVKSLHEIACVKERISIKAFYEMFCKIPLEIWILCIINFIQNIVTSPLWSMVLPLYLTISLGVSISVMGYIYTMDNLLGVPTSILGGFLGDNYSSKKVFVVLMIFASILGFFMFFVKRKIYFIIVLLIFMMIFSISSPILESIESICSRDGKSGFDLGVVSLFVTFGTVIGQCFSGKLMSLFDKNIWFIFLGIGYLLMAIIVHFGVHEYSTKECAAITKSSKEVIM